ncbi:MAG: hydroxymethylglutaryl-CoA synthase family protein [Dehalococcoidia bacterium]|nr:hydroxymethylglutaryl-CoA synthase family protein [Dehalococcoidia bacterium]
MRGIIAYGAYIPSHRLDRKAIGDALGAGGGKGTRAVASYDEDTTTMGVEAGRIALHGQEANSPQALYFATAEPGYLDKTNATAIHAALDLEPGCFVADMLGSVRSGAGALRAALDARVPAMAVVSDIRIGLPSSADEGNGGDGAAAFLCGESDGVIAEYVGGASVSAEFLDRYRAPGEQVSQVWEERFGEFVYVPLAQKAFKDSLSAANVTLEHIDHFVVAGMHGRANKAFVGSSGVRKEAVTDDAVTVIGNSGTAQAGIMLADVLDRAQPDQLITVVFVADGVTVMHFRTTAAIASYQRATTVAAQRADGRAVSYQSYLTWRGLLNREPPRRPDPARPAAPPSFRSDQWKFGFECSRCKNCGTRHLPPARVCLKCHAVDEMERERLADVKATIATFTIDRLAFSPSPPLVAAVLDFDGGGRLPCEMTDVDPNAVAIGDRVEMTFRRLYTAQDVHNYFWKARPVRGGN